MNKALDYGVESSTVLDQVASTVSQNPSPAFTDSARIADLLLTHLEIAEARQVPTDLFEFINDILVSTYPPEPRNKVTSIWLLRSLTRVIGACPQELALQLFEIIRDGVAVWVTDSFSVFNREEYDDEVRCAFCAETAGSLILIDTRLFPSTRRRCSAFNRYHITSRF